MILQEIYCAVLLSALGEALKFLSVSCQLEPERYRSAPSESGEEHFHPSGV